MDPLKFFDRLALVFIFTATLVLIFWGFRSFFEEIPPVGQIFIENKDGYPDIRRFDWPFTFGLSRFWLDLIGFPLILTTCNLFMKLQSRWLLKEEILSSTLVGIALGILFGAMSLIFGIYSGLTLAVLGLVIIYIIASGSMIVKMLKCFFKKTDFLETYRETFLLLFIITPMTIVFIASLEFGGIFGFILLVGYVSVMAVPIFGSRGLWLLGIILIEMYKKRIAVLKKT